LTKTRHDCAKGGCRANVHYSAPCRRCSEAYLRFNADISVIFFNIAAAVFF